MLRMFCARSRFRTLMYRNGATSLSASISTGRPRISFDATSASSAEYAASTAWSAVSACGRSRSVITLDMVLPAKPRAASNFQRNRERPGLGIFGDFLDRPHLGGLLLQRVRRDSV